MDAEVLPILRIVLRLVHILTGVTWFGISASLLFFIAPALRDSGESGLRFLKAMYTRTALTRVLPVVAIITVIAGLLLYLVTDSASYFTKVGNMVLGTGSLFGFLAAGHSLTATNKATQRLQQAAQQHIQDKGSPTEEGVATVTALAAKLNIQSKIGFYLTLLALIMMALARYL